MYRYFEKNLSKQKFVLLIFKLDVFIMPDSLRPPGLQHTDNINNLYLQLPLTLAEPIQKHVFYTEQYLL